MVYISQLYTINNYFIREAAVAESIDLPKALDNLTKKQIVTKNDKIEIQNNLKQKVDNFNENIIEIGSYLSDLRYLTAQGFVFRNELDNIHNLNKNKLFSNPRDELLIFENDYLKILNENKFAESEKKQLLQIWQRFKNLYNIPNKSEFIEIETESVKLLKAKFTTIIEQTPISEKLNFNYFSPDEQEIRRKELTGVKDPYPFATNNLTWKYYLKAMSYFIANQNPEHAATKAITYFNCFIDYHFNNKNNTPFDTIAFEKGDCTEMTSLLYVVLQHTQAKNIRIFYLKDAELNSGHVFLTYEYNGYVCFADQGGAHKYNNFKEGLTKRYAEYAKIVEVNPRYFLYPSLAPKEYFSKLEKNYIDLDIFNY